MVGITPSLYSFDCRVGFWIAATLLLESCHPSQERWYVCPAVHIMVIAVLRITTTEPNSAVTATSAIPVRMMALVELRIMAMVVDIANNVIFAIRNHNSSSATPWLSSPLNSIIGTTRRAQPFCGQLSLCTFGNHSGICPRLDSSSARLVVDSPRLVRLPRLSHELEQGWSSKGKEG
jgi:hypothetical protein